MMRRALLFAALLLAGCAQEPQRERGTPIDFAQVNADGERQITPAYRTPVISDDGRELGAVRHYVLDRDGRIVAAAPADRRLAPADAPALRPSA